MKISGGVKIFPLLAAIAFCVGAHAQTYEVTLTWTASASQCESNCAEGMGPTLVNVYRAQTTTGGCTGSVWAQIATDVPAAGPYLDTSAPAGTDECYEVRAYFVLFPSVESGGSNWALVKIPAAAQPPKAPSALGGKISIQ